MIPDTDDLPKGVLMTVTAPNGAVLTIKPTDELHRCPVSMDTKAEAVRVFTECHRED